MDRITILIVDDHSLFRDGLRSLLERQEGLAVIGEAGDAEAGIRLAEELRPAIILMDLHLPGRGGIEAIREIVRRNRDARIIALTMYQEPDLIDNALLAGARGYLLKDERIAGLVEAIRAVADGAAAFDPHVSAHVLEEYRRLAAEAGRGRSDEPGLSPREISVLEYLANGLSNRQIAKSLFLSEQTIKNILTSIYHKLGVQNRTEAVMQAVQRGFIRRP